MTAIDGSVVVQALNGGLHELERDVQQLDT